MKSTNYLSLPLEVRDVFLSYSVLRLDNFEQSHDLLCRAARIAAPIARKRGWKVGKLKEFNPKNRGLLGLNVNGGAEVCIRTRGSSGFFDFESVLHTLLHELVHIVHGPHSAEFYEMLDGLVREAESVAFRAQYGVGEVSGRFWGQGQRLGGSGSSSSLLRSMNQTTGHRLGGNRSYLPPTEAAARAALARLRVEDHETCGTQRMEEGEQGLDEEIEEVVPVSAPLGDIPVTAVGSALHVENANVVDSRSIAEPVKVVRPTVATLPAADCITAKTSTSTMAPKHPIIVIELEEEDELPKSETSLISIAQVDEELWYCDKCTLGNRGVVCQACQSTRPNLWSCDRCTYANVLEHLQCLACNSIRRAPQSECV